MITKTYITKSNTITKDSDLNFGLNPISTIEYGVSVSRSLIYFDVAKLAKGVSDGTYKDVTKFTHRLKMKNCGSINSEYHDKTVPSNDINGVMDRATSFTLIFFTIPQMWDEGVGFDARRFWIRGRGAVSENGSTWYQGMNGSKWDEEGIYSNETLSNELEKYLNGEESVIIATQHFDHGNENIDIDITDYVNNIIMRRIQEEGSEGISSVVFGDDTFSGVTGVNDNGIGIAFIPDLEEVKTKRTQYVGFFNGHTNTFFEPYVESEYHENVNDDRYKFYLNKDNRVYFFARVGGKLVDLDEMPTCTIEDRGEYAVKCDIKGCYYIDIFVGSDENQPEDILYDVWSNIKYKGKTLDDVEMEIPILSDSEYLQLGDITTESKELMPVITGINDDAKLIQNQLIRANVFFKIPYTSAGLYELLNTAQYRVYVIDEVKEIDVYPWQNIMTMSKNNIFYLDTSEMLPSEYHIDVRYDYDGEVKLFKDIKRFKIVSNETRIKR